MRAIKRAGFAAAALLGFAILLAPAAAQEIVNFYGFRFPEKIGVLTRTNITDFEKQAPGYGHGIRYSAAPFARLDIFVYDKRLPKISDDVYSAEHKKEFLEAEAELQRAKQRGLYKDVVAGAAFEVPDVTRPFFSCRMFRITRDSGDEDSALCLGARNNKFFKIRLSFAALSPDAMNVAKGLVREVGNAVDF
jgi:hypothetical protein